MNGLCQGQEDSYARPLFQLAVNLNVPARLLDEAIDHAKTKAGASTRRLRREERFESAPTHLLRHPRACIGYGNEDIATGADFWVHLRVVRIKAGLRQIDRQVSAARHRVSRINREVEQGVLQLWRIHDT